MARFRKARGEQWPAAYRNNLSFRYYYNLLKSVAMSCFEWHNIPPEIDVRFLEKTLFEFGYALFFYDEIAEKYVALTCSIGGRINLYRIPMERRAYAPNNYNVDRDMSNSVLIYNNMLHTNMVEEITKYAIQLSDIDMAIQTNVKAQKTPVLIRTSPEQLLTMKNMYEQYDGNVPFIFGDKDLAMSSFDVLKTEAPFVAENLQFLKMQIYSEAMSFLGIESDPSLKKERLVADEISNSMGNVLANRYNRLNERNFACDEINRMFGLNMSVTFRSEFVPGASGDTTGLPVLEEVTADE